MNLRSVFTAEQQRILQRYYDNGMTNQSKSCFQLILQCAQEAKLDFSVVRTWVGNKRRKLTSKTEQNGVAQGPPNHGLAGGGGGGAMAGAVLAAEIAAMRGVSGIQRGVPLAHLLPPASSSSPSSSSSSSSSPPCSSSSTSDVIVTGVYTLAPSSSRVEPAKTAPKPPPQTHAHTPLRGAGSPVYSKPAVPPRKGLQAGPPSTAYCQVKRSFPGAASPGAEPAGAPRTWARQFPAQHQPWGVLSEPPPPAPSSGPAPHPSFAPRPRGAQAGVRIQQVFTLAPRGGGEPQQKPAGQRGGGCRTRAPDSTSCFSIAMETGDADDEYAREEELASMGAQMQICPAGGGSSRSSSSSSSEPGALRQRDSPGGLVPGHSGAGAGAGNTAGVTPPSSDSSPTAPYPGSRGYQAPSTSSHYPPGHSALFSSTAPRGGYPGKVHGAVPSHGSPQRVGNYQVSGNLTVPWITSNSRKRTLQDRTQFSDRDLATLKKFWDNGMTSLGSICREKITAVAAELSVDCEIIKTWIGNRRRKYRLMGIEIPPPKGGPADFTDQPEPGSPGGRTPGGETAKTPELAEDSDHNDEVSICLSEDGVSDTYQREEGEDMDGETNSTALTDNVKIEIIDDEEEEEDEEDASGSDVEQMQTLLDYKHEEVRFLENELENQKQKYYELQNFTRNLLVAVKSNNTEKQQELLSKLPQEIEEDLELDPGPEESSGSMLMIQGYSSVSEEKVDPGPL
nr:PREDICTED: highly divergent homeobox isoform X1 [Lepisosteus oculatus]XP_015207102.1 PREDICTED: highly divergent homeobox isoform X1 [Lepisosteus oculatus]XP_015207103.1 PREDICTED: highly divergent homeobox isoform X1 [Lepisosteus oculatus]XP_015207104.1 PREDICTED: highly divergent homeobox isoform X1 [Lepisosteus oculatus]